MSPTIKTIAIATVAATALMAMPDIAHASDGGLGPIADHLRTQLGSIGGLIGAFAFVMGLGFGASGLMKFRQHSDNPNAVPISQPLVRIIVGAMLIALPAVIGTGIGSIFGTEADTVDITGENFEINSQ